MVSKNFPPPLSKVISHVEEVAAVTLLPVIEEDYEQYEEETLCVDGDLPRFEDDELYFPLDRE